MTRLKTLTEYHHCLTREEATALCAKTRAEQPRAQVVMHDWFDRKGYTGTTVKIRKKVTP